MHTATKKYSRLLYLTIGLLFGKGQMNKKGSGKFGPFQSDFDKV